MLFAKTLCAALEHSLCAGTTEGWIHSVFDRAVNIMTAGGMISILPAEKGLYPWSCTVNTDAPFAGIGLRLGMRVTVNRAGIRVNEAGFTVDLNGAAVQDLDVFEGVSSNASAQLCLPVLKALLLTQGSHDGMLPLALNIADNPFSAMIRPKLTALHAALLASDPDAAALASAAIAGCGLGLTPSSDDMLLGYVCAYYPLALAKGLKRREVLAMGRSACYAAAKKTNDISGAFLIRCGDGLASQNILDLLNVIFSGAPADQLQASVSRILSIGSSSGSDILCGIVLSLQTQGFAP